MLQQQLQLWYQIQVQKLLYMQIIQIQIHQKEGVPNKVGMDLKQQNEHEKLKVRNHPLALGNVTSYTMNSINAGRMSQNRLRFRSESRASGSTQTFDSSGSHGHGSRIHSKSHKLMKENSYLELILTRPEQELRNLFEIFDLKDTNVSLNFEEFTRVCLVLRKDVQRSVTIHTVSKLYWELVEGPAGNDESSDANSGPHGVGQAANGNNSQGNHVNGNVQNGHDRADSTDPFGARNESEGSITNSHHGNVDTLRDALVKQGEKDKFNHHHHHHHHRGEGVTVHGEGSNEHHVSTNGRSLLEIDKKYKKKNEVWLLDLLLKMRASKQKIALLDYDHPLIYATKTNNIKLVTLLINSKYHESSYMRQIEYRQCIITSIKEGKYRITMALCEHKGIPIVIEIIGCKELETKKVETILRDGANKRMSDEKERHKRRQGVMSDTETKDSKDNESNKENNLAEDKSGNKTIESSTNATSEHKSNNNTMSNTSGAQTRIRNLSIHSIGKINPEDTPSFFSSGDEDIFDEMSSDDSDDDMTIFGHSAKNFMDGIFNPCVSVTINQTFEKKTSVLHGIELSKVEKQIQKQRKRRRRRSYLENFSLDRSYSKSSSKNERDNNFCI